MLVIRFNEKYGILTDEMGIPLSHKECRTLLRQIKLHLSHSPEELRRINYEIMSKKYPKTAEKLEFTVENFA